MKPPLFALISSNAGVQSKFGVNPVRVYPFGQAPERVVRPYAVFQIVSGAPENYIAGAPDLDSFTVQLDVYGETPTSARAGAEALRDALEAHAHIIAWRGEVFDSTANLFRYSFDLDFLVQR